MILHYIDVKWYELGWWNVNDGTWTYHEFIAGKLHDGNEFRSGYGMVTEFPESHMVMVF